MSGRASASDGIVLVDKPAGPTSHDIVAAQRRRLGRGVKVGHAGTLDPFATGLLIVLIGRATRLQSWFMALPKTYRVIARFGWVSDTGDRDGRLQYTGRVPTGQLALPVGRLRQRPPAYSAVKLGGRRAYALARAGEAVEVPEREVRVERFVERWRSGERRCFEIECGSGTYVRSLVADLGDAYCAELRRTRIGPFDVLGAAEHRIIPLDAALARFLPAVALSESDALAVRHGRDVGVQAAGSVRLLAPDGELLALGEPREGGVVHPSVGLCQ